VWRDDLSGEYYYVDDVRAVSEKLITRTFDI